MKRLSHKRNVIGVILALCLGLSMTPLTLGYAQDMKTVSAQFRVWEGTQPGGEEWDTDLNGKANVFALGSLGPSQDGRYIIAPGTGGSYAFTIENVSEGTMTYQCTFSGDNPYEIPLEVRLHTIDGGEDGYFIGSPDTWVPVDQLDEFTTSFDTQDTETLVFEWQWPFEVSEEQDAADTALGVAATETIIPYDMVITIQAEAEDTGNGAPLEPLTEPGSSTTSQASQTGQTEQTGQTSSGGSSDVSTGDTAGGGVVAALLASFVLLVTYSTRTILRRRKGADHE